MTTHTILLVQTDAKKKDSRTFSDHETVSSAVEEVVRLYEKRLKVLNPGIPQITYDVSDLNNYIDSLGDLAALVYSQKIGAYVPHDKEWIKIATFNHLRKVAG